MPEKKPAPAEAVEGADGENAKINSGTAGAGDLTSPDAILNFIIAVVFDGIGLIPVVGTFSDIFAGIYFAIWMIATNKRGWWKFLAALILEAFPIVSDITPFVSMFGILVNFKLPASWIGFVYCVLSSGSGNKQ